jgi:hypothetical protein
MSQAVNIKLNPGVPWQKHRSTRRLFALANWTYLRKKVVKCYIWSRALCGAETGDSSEKKNTREVLKCGAGEGWRRSVGLIV